jgi:hypothetical protein
LGEQKQALIRVGVIIEIPLLTEAEDDDEFVADVMKSADVSEAVSTLVSAAIEYQGSDDSRVEHKIRFSRLVLMHDESATVANLGWSEVK